MLSLRMQGENEVRRLYEETTGVPALEQKGLFNAELEGEMALEFMRTASPLTVIQNIVIPFMGCCCYLMDSCDEAIVRNESVKKEIASLKRIATQVSEEFEDNVINEERLDAFASQLRVTEEVVSKVGVLLRITEGDEKIVEALMAKALRAAGVLEGGDERRERGGQRRRRHRDAGTGNLCDHASWREADLSLLELLRSLT